MKKPIEYGSSDELVRHLKVLKHRFGHYFNRRVEDLQDIIRSSVGRNTFRAFHHTPKKPSDVFRVWARDRLTDTSVQSQILGIRSQADFDEWLQGFSAHFSHAWNKQMGPQKAIPYGPSRKLPNLLLKGFVCWGKLTAAQQKRLIGFLHVPFDSYTLRAVRNCVPTKYAKEIRPIPMNATMKFVKDRKDYDALQQVARCIGRRAGVPPIYLDFVWNEAHP